MTSLDRRDNVSRGEAAAIPGQVRRWRAFALLAVSFLMTVIDLTIVNVALPTIGRKLHFPQSDLQWVVTAYALTLGGFLLLGGRAADLLGRRRLFMAGLILFTASSLLSGLAWSEGSLIAFRALQGLGGGRADRGAARSGRAPRVRRAIPRGGCGRAAGRRRSSPASLARPRRGARAR